MVHAIRNGQKKTFNDTVWHRMPPDKYGWSEFTENPNPPKFVTDELEARAAKSEPETEFSPAPKQGRKSKKNAVHDNE